MPDEVTPDGNGEPAGSAVGRASYEAIYLAVLEALRRAVSCPDAFGNIDGRNGHWVGIASDIDDDLYLETHGSPDSNSCEHSQLTDQQVAALGALGWNTDRTWFLGHLSRRLDPSSLEDAASFVARTFEDVLTPGGGASIGWEVWCVGGDKRKWRSDRKAPD